MREIRIADVLGAAGDYLALGGFREGNNWDGLDLSLEGIDGDGITPAVDSQPARKTSLKPTRSKSALREALTASPIIRNPKRLLAGVES